jgi:hypothetical protein
MIKILENVSGLDSKGRPYDYHEGEIIDPEEFIVSDLIKHGKAEWAKKGEGPARPMAIAPEIKRGKIIDAVIKRGRKPKRRYKLSTLRR